MKIKATDKFEKSLVTDKEVNRIREKGEIWETTIERAEYLIESGYATEVKEKANLTKKK